MENEWKTICASTKAKVHRSYVKDGITYSSEKLLNGTPQEVKRQLAPTYPGEIVDLQHVHTMITQEREFHSPTTHGVVKEREERTLQVYGFGEKEMNKKFMGTENPTSPTPKNPGFYDPSERYGTKEEEKKEDCKEFVLTMFKDLSQRISNVDTRVWITMGLAAFAVGLSLYGLM